MTPASGAVVSQVTSEDDGPTIEVCRECGLREMVRKVVKADLPSYTEWPLPIDTLVDEDRMRLEWLRPVEVYAPDGSDPRGGEDGDQ